MIVLIKHMVSVRCKIAVRDVLDSLKIDYISIDLGQVHVKKQLMLHEQLNLDSALRVHHLELMIDGRIMLVERIKELIVDLFHKPEIELRLKFSEYLMQQLNHDYTYLSNAFCEFGGSTIEKFYITRRVERVKELMISENLSASEISDYLNFSSVSHLCRQFKKVTGQTPAAFKKLSVKKGVEAVSANKRGLISASGDKIQLNI